MSSEVLIGREWILVNESDTEIMVVLEDLEQRQTSTRLRDRWALLTMAGSGRTMKIDPQAIHGIREPAGLAALRSANAPDGVRVDVLHASTYLAAPSAEEHGDCGEDHHAAEDEKQDEHGFTLHHECIPPVNAHV